MPLKVRIKPEKKLFIGDVVIKNAGNRPADLLILSDHKVEREDRGARNQMQQLQNLPGEAGGSVDIPAGGERERGGK